MIFQVGFSHLNCHLAGRAGVVIDLVYIQVGTHLLVPGGFSHLNSVGVPTWAPGPTWYSQGYVLSDGMVSSSFFSPATWIYVHFVAPDQSLFYKRYIYNVKVSLYIISRCRDPEM